MLALSLVFVTLSPTASAANTASARRGPRSSQGFTVAHCPWLTATTAPALAAEVLARMTLREELDVITLVSTKPFENSTTPVPALCIPSLTMQDGPDGLAYGDTGVTQFPAAIGLAATFDPSLAYAEGAALGAEAHAQGVDAVQGPYLNLARVPQGGRVFEGYGEDPELAGAMGVADVTGIQSAGVLADVKDLGVYTQETNRDFINQIVPEQALQELYLAPFRAVVEHAGVASVMCGFGEINGVVTCEDSAVLGELRRWGFVGFVRDDINAAPGGAAALAAGLDVFKPSPFVGSPQERVDAALRRDIATATLRVLTEMFRFGLVQRPLTGTTSTPVETPAARAVALQVAERGAVLLKDAGGVLPLPAATPSIAVIGTDANGAPISSGGGSSHVIVGSVVTPLQAVRARWPAARIYVAPGEPAVAPPNEIPNSVVVPPLPVPPPPPTHRIYHTNAPPSGTWRTWSGTLTPRASGLYRLALLSHGDTYLALDGRQLVADPGAHGPTMIYLGESLTAGRHYELTMRWLDYDGNVPTLGWQDVTSMIHAAAVAASRAKVALVFAGDARTEGADATSLGLSGVQDELIAAVARANPRTVVVLDTGGAVLMPWLDEVRAVLEAWYPGELDGTAVTALLSGTWDPSGRLPVSFPTSAMTTSVSSSTSLFPGRKQAPAGNPVINDTVDLAASGGGGLDVGYRYYEAHHVPVLFPFGFGLSYTRFSLGELTLARSGGGVVASLKVTDTGARAGSAVVEAYLHDPSAAGQPPLALAAFASVPLQPRGSAIVRLEVPAGAFATWQRSGFVTVPGRYVVEVGSSSADLPLKASVTMR